MAQSLRGAFTSVGCAQQELTVLTIFLLVFAHVNGTTSQMTSLVHHWLLKIDC